MGPFEMVVAIVGIGAVSSVIRTKYGYRRRKRMDGSSMYGDRDEALVAENGALRDEMHGMKQRIQVLERLATDDESDARRLDREIEKLRETRVSGKDLSRE